MTQYTDRYSTVSSSYLSYFQNHIGALDNAIAFRTGQYEYGCLIQSPNGDVEQIILSNAGDYIQTTNSTLLS